MRKLNRDGFVLSYLSAISEEDYNSSLTDRNQLKLEAMLRRAVSEKKPSELPPCSLGVGDRIGNAEWQPYYSHGSIFVDRSSFYSLLQRIKMYVASVLVADEDITAEAVLWTYMSTGVYLNGKLISETEHPVYKPIQSVKCTLNLRKGRNELVFLSDNLGVRDTRNMLAFQILTNRDHILTTIPDADNEEEYSEGADFLDGIKIGRGSLSFSSEPPAGSCSGPSPEAAPSSHTLLRAPSSPYRTDTHSSLSPGVSHPQWALTGRRTPPGHTPAAHSQSPGTRSAR